MWEPPIDNGPSSMLELREMELAQAEAALTEKDKEIERLEIDIADYRGMHRIISSSQEFRRELIETQKETLKITADSLTTASERITELENALDKIWRMTAIKHCLNKSECINTCKDTNCVGYFAAMGDTDAS